MQLAESNEILKQALGILEPLITVPVKPGEGKFTLNSKDCQQIGHVLPFSDLTPDKITEIMTEIAVGVNAAGFPISIPPSQPLALAFADNAVGEKVYLRFVVGYDVQSDRYLARFDVIVAQPVAVEVAA